MVEVITWVDAAGGASSGRAKAASNVARMPSWRSPDLAPPSKSMRPSGAKQSRIPSTSRSSTAWAYAGDHVEDRLAVGHRSGIPGSQ